MLSYYLNIQRMYTQSLYLVVFKGLNPCDELYLTNVPSPQCAGRARAPAARAPMLGVQPRRPYAQSTGTASAPPTGHL